jgi:hypothetical protein
MASRSPNDPPASSPDPDFEEERLDEGLEESFPASDPPSQLQPHPQQPQKK